MKSKQLANVLIKILGLSICLYSVPSFVAGVAYDLMANAAAKVDATAFKLFAATVGAGVQAGFGILVICLSRTIAGWMFKDSDE